MRRTSVHVVRGRIRAVGLWERLWRRPRLVVVLRTAWWGRRLLSGGELRLYALYDAVEALRTMRVVRTTAWAR
jgi:hypothetical protein